MRQIKFKRKHMAYVQAESLKAQKKQTKFAVLFDFFVRYGILYSEKVLARGNMNALERKQSNAKRGKCLIYTITKI